MRCHLYSSYSQGRPTFVRSTSPAQGELRVPAAGGVRRELAISAAVENPEDQRKPDGIFGHRKVDRCRQACHAPPGDGGGVFPSRRIGRTFLLLPKERYQRKRHQGGELRPCAAGGRRSKAAISAAAPLAGRREAGPGMANAARWRDFVFCPPCGEAKNAARLRFSLHFSTAAEKAPALHPPLAAGWCLSPSLDPPSLKRPNGACEPLLDFPGMHPGLYVGAGIPDSPLCFPLRGNCRLRAAGGRGSEAGISAAVEKPEDQRKPERLFGHRKVDRWREAPDEVPAKRIITAYKGKYPGCLPVQFRTPNSEFPCLHTYFTSPRPLFLLTFSRISL